MQCLRIPRKRGINLFQMSKIKSNQSLLASLIVSYVLLNKHITAVIYAHTQRAKKKSKNCTQKKSSAFQKFAGLGV